MARLSLAFLICLSALVPALAQEPTVTPLSRYVLTNESIITLARAGFDELFIIERIHTSRTRFDTSVEGLVALKQAGLSEDLIRVMALHDLHTFPVPLEAATAAAVRPVKVSIEKHWWGYRWNKINPQ
jgi:hypothetical protein